MKGAIKGAEELSHIADPAQIILNQLMPKIESPLQKLIEQFLPTREEPTEQFLERAGKLAPTAALGGGVLGTILGSLGGTALGEVAKDQSLGEVGQGISEAVGMGLPGFAKSLGKGAVNLFKSPL